MKQTFKSVFFHLVSISGSHSFHPLLFFNARCRTNPSFAQVRKARLPAEGRLPLSHVPPQVKDLLYSLGSYISLVFNRSFVYHQGNHACQRRMNVDGIMFVIEAVNSVSRPASVLSNSLSGHSIDKEILDHHSFIRQRLAKIYQYRGQACNW